MKRALWLYGPPIAWASLIFWLSSQPTLPSTMGGDKLAHLVTYAALSALTLRALYFGTSWSIRAVIAAAALAATLYGASDEFHQTFVPGRDASIEDWLADTGGAILGATALWFLYRWRKAERS